MKPILFEMDVEGKGRLNIEPFHNSKAGTVCEGKVFVIIFAKDIPSPFPVNGGNRCDCKKDIGLQGFTKFYCSFAAYCSGKEIIGFYENQIGCDQGSSLKDKVGIELASYLCIRIISVSNCDPCSGINKDFHFFGLLKCF